AANSLHDLVQIFGRIIFCVITFSCEEFRNELFDVVLSQAHCGAPPRRLSASRILCASVLGLGGSNTVPFGVKKSCATRTIAGQEPAIVQPRWSGLCTASSRLRTFCKFGAHPRVVSKSCIRSASVRTMRPSLKRRHRYPPIAS